MTDRIAFSVDWYGPEDKPFPRAAFVAADRSGDLDLPWPWKYVRIDRDEFNALVAALVLGGVAIRYSEDDLPDGYVAVIEAAESRAWAPLGCDAATAHVLGQMQSTLSGDRGHVLGTLVDRLRAADGE